MTAPVLIFAIGNESRGDDALGPLLLRRLKSYEDQAELLEDFQLQIEHSMDMKDRNLVLFIDAGMDTPSPFAFYRAAISEEQVLYSHALSPEALLKVYTQLYQDAPPDSFVLCIKGESFELGEAPSSQAVANLASALEFAGRLLNEADAAIWDSRCTRQAVIRSAQGSSQLTR